MSDAAHGITTGAVARRLGVSPTTVRSWDQRYGIGPAVRADGRHRRWSPADVAMLEEMCRLTASGVPPAEAARAARRVRPAPETAAPDAAAGPPPTGPGARTGPGASSEDVPPGRTGRAGPGSGLPLGDVRRECRGLARAAVRLDGPAMERLLQEVLAEHGLVTAWEEVMAPTLHAVGRKWESSGDRYVEVEHLLSWHVSTALRRAAATGPAIAPSAAPAAPVVLACVPAEQHTLPLEALAAGLAERGVPTRMFGAAVPAEALDAAVRRSGPVAVALWSQARSTANHSLARHVAATAFGVRGARTAPLVLLAGPGWLGRTPAPGMVRPTGLREAIGVVSRLYGEPTGSGEG
ncbi:MerR family transcriptional regulator [Streptomyces sp. TLI_105]|uniref:MerR family transcriptional regulator n=1 Tax=Streptomyces sp. TLI_105 TaxID=1881019 RepID=UPI00089A0E3C|nr:MerR family transcriptional regulator [Streptomyces sp. TLI_105]SEE19692.1 B12 binding domain-containing protein [Streptomyces sp. TLI_105]